MMINKLFGSFYLYAMMSTYYDYVLVVRILLSLKLAMTMILFIVKHPHIKNALTRSLSEKNNHQTQIKPAKSVNY